MTVKQLPKDIDRIMEYALDDTILFVEYHTRKLKNGKCNDQVFSKSIQKMSICEIASYINNPNVVILKFEGIEAQ